MSATAEKHGSDVAINSRIERSPTCSSPCRRSTCRANSGSAWALVLLFGRDHGHGDDGIFPAHEVARASFPAERVRRQSQPMRRAGIGKAVCGAAMPTTQAQSTRRSHWTTDRWLGPSRNDSSDCMPLSSRRGSRIPPARPAWQSGPPQPYRMQTAFFTRRAAPVAAFCQASAMCRQRL